MIKKRGLVMWLAGATLALGLFPAPANAVPTCPHGANVIAWPATVNPDRNENGFICLRLVSPDMRPIFTDDRDV